MKKPTLVVMAAGMGSRFGGLKQMTPIDPQGNSMHSRCSIIFLIRV